MLVRVADHCTYARQRGDFFGSALRVASGDDDFGLRVLALYAAYGGAGILIGGVGDGEGVEDDQVSLLGRGSGLGRGFRTGVRGRHRRACVARHPKFSTW